MPISEVMKKYIQKLFGKDRETPFVSDYHQCVRCRRRYKYIPGPPPIDQVEKIVGYDRQLFCSEQCAVQPERVEGKSRQSRRHALREECFKEVCRRFGGEPRVARRRMAMRWAANLYREERRKLVA